MNILVLFGAAAVAIAMIWVAESIALLCIGAPLAWPLQYKTRSPVVRMTSQVMIQVAWIVMVAAPLVVLGISPQAALRQAFPLPVPWRQMGIAFLIMFVPMGLTYALYIKAGWLRIEPKYDQASRRWKLFWRFMTPLPLATFEEAVFRGTLLEQLLRSLPSTLAFSALAVVVSAAIFAAVHFIKPARGKPVLLGLYGYFTAGCLFGIAYIIGGRSLWLPIVLHATAILVIEIMRLYTVHRVPGWVAGFAEGPHAGVFGSAFLVVMAIALIVLI